ncbi:aromatic-ring-hydroxylating dioxygenase subunit beta [Rhodococcus sp. F64268]|uniref:aromatic-ring-hydroxylating dioxygenase subunit beta n=1 Tax=unclassified Rhodococcus (in: high G+C Gram-positive bacteria) TaxID=192944 RepID=UPI001F114EE2|nr:MULTISPECIES: aromatic-ring-hydroxylating dioxygenase subunit beta [unclassified Rhodococcus (in: high G+C Gram-positive bacteria)]MCK0089454.1 aromatic-ring-hydroxylating dioxygenase subunit beta [Rhodococcus sp. F64268]
MTTQSLIAKRPLATSDPRHVDVVDFLHYEAELLDNLEERRWLSELVSRDIEYQVPVRETVERARGTGFSATTFHLKENLGSLDSRVTRGETKYAWAEDPPSRVRHFVTNIRVRPHESADDLIRVKSNILIYRTRQSQTTPQMLSGERDDVLRREGGELKLLRRTVYLDLSVIGTHNLSLFF